MILNLAAHYCDKLLVLHGGAIEAFGSPSEVVTAGPDQTGIRREHGRDAASRTGVPQLLLRPEIPPAANASGWQAGQGDDARRSEGDDVLAEQDANARDGKDADARGGKDADARDGKDAGTTDGIGEERTEKEAKG